MQCPKCQTANDDHAIECSLCGADLPKLAAAPPAPGLRTSFGGGGEGARAAGVKEADALDNNSGLRTVAAPVERRSDSLAVGALFAGRYEVLQKGLKGGMGMVYKVRDTTLQKTTALKTVLPEFLENASAVSRFKQEVAITQELLHENIVRVYDIGQTEDTLYFTMEWVDGVTLKDYIDERKKSGRRFTLEEITSFARQICGALSYAHKSIIHRDIKPENILVVDRDKDEVKLKIMDFGIAKTDTSSLHVSQSAYMGTPIYMAPEQYTEASHVDKRADIYSVGVVLYELMTFTLPLGTFSMPSEVNPALPVPIDGVIRRTMSPDRNKRYADALEIVADLERVAGGDVVATSVAPAVQMAPRPLASEAVTLPHVEKPEEPIGGKPSREEPARSNSPPVPTKGGAGKYVAIAVALVVLVGGGLMMSGRNKSDTSSLPTSSAPAVKAPAQAAVGGGAASQDAASAAAKQEQAARQQAEAHRYIADGKRYYDQGKFELSMEKMKEALRYDRNNQEAKQYLAWSQQKFDEIQREFVNPQIGRSR